MHLCPRWRAVCAETPRLVHHNVPECRQPSHGAPRSLLPQGSRTALRQDAETVQDGTSLGTEGQGDREGTVAGKALRRLIGLGQERETTTPHAALPRRRARAPNKPQRGGDSANPAPAAHQGEVTTRPCSDTPAALPAGSGPRHKLAFNPRNRDGHLL